MKHNVNIPGWAGDIYPWLEEVASKYIPLNGVYMEVGTFFGASLAHMGTLRPDIRLISVDPWKDGVSQGYEGPSEYMPIVESHGGLFLTFLHFMRTEAPDVLRRTSVLRGTAATIRVTEPVDVLFLDGAHDKESVELDINVFAHLVRPGGLVAGHDYGPNDPGVVGAVHATYPKEEVQVRGTVWWVEV